MRTNSEKPGQKSHACIAPSLDREPVFLRRSWRHICLSGRSGSESAKRVIRSYLVSTLNPQPSARFNGGLTANRVGGKNTPCTQKVFVHEIALTVSTRYYIGVPWQSLDSYLDSKLFHSAKD
jgi:hypothetical protein